MARRGKKTEKEGPTNDWASGGDNEYEEPKVGLGFQMLKAGEGFEGRLLTKPIWFEKHPDTGVELTYPGRMSKVDGVFYDTKSVQTPLNDEWLQILESLYKELIPFMETGKREFCIERKGTYTWEVEVLTE